MFRESVPGASPACDMPGPEVVQSVPPVGLFTQHRTSVKYFTLVALWECYARIWRGQMAKTAGPSYSIVKQERGWFWCSYAVQEIRGRSALIGPFPSQEEAEKDARETFGLKEGKQ